jgi:8-oxo-dGTP pyrophosphatase MutT (NUDIX family)
MIKNENPLNVIIDSFVSNNSNTYSSEKPHIGTSEKFLYCINCGKKGHVYKKCLYPIISIGIICVKFKINDFDINHLINYSKKIQNNYLFSLDEITKIKNIKKRLLAIYKLENYNNIIEYLFIRRKHSLNYVEFIRGKYDINNSDYLERSFNFITNEEIKLIKSHDFEYLWKDMWGVNTISNEFQESKDKFEIFKKGIIIKKNDINMLVSFDTLINRRIFNFKEPEWGFPKGRRNLKEKNIECAKREFEEETSLTQNCYNILNITPLEETYLATNNIKYKHIYYISQINNNNINLTIDKNNSVQQMEVSDIKWLNFDDAMNTIRSYNIEKKNILFNLHNSIKDIIEIFIVLTADI